MRVDVPAGMAAFPVAASTGQRSVGYRSAADGQGRSGVLLVIVADSAERSAKAEAEALVGLKRDVHRATDVTVEAVQVAGFTAAYRVQYDDASATAGGASPLHGLTVIAQGTSGELVNVSAVAPRALFDQLDLAKAVGLLRLAGAPS